MFESSTAVGNRNGEPSSVTGLRTSSLETVSVPVHGPREALIKVDAVGMCASDLKCYHRAAKFWGDESRPSLGRD